MRKLNSRNPGGRILSFFLAVVMLISIVPLNAFAEGEPGTPGHEHTEACIESRTLICGYPEQPDQEQKLLCETEEHSHTDDCYALNCGGHVHSEACYALNCGEDHTHTNECYVLNCKEGHTHTDDCRTLTCETAEHTHTVDCYTAVHQHTTECYQVSYNCQSTDADQAEPVDQTSDISQLDLSGVLMDSATQDISHLLTTIDITGAELIDGEYVVEAKKGYGMTLTFRENPADNQEFNMGPGGISFPLPAGITAENVTDGKITIGVSTMNGYCAIEHDYSIDGNVLHINWNSGDANFGKLAAAHNIEFHFNLNVIFDGSTDTVTFGESNTVVIHIDKTGSITINKNVNGLPDGTLTEDEQKNMVFELRKGDANGELVETFTYFQMMPRGSITIEELEPGTYTLVEKSHPKITNYTLELPAPVTGDLAIRGHLEFTMTNNYTYNTGSLNLKKTVNWTNWDGSNTMPDGMKEKIKFQITGPTHFPKEQQKTYNKTYADFENDILSLTDLPVGEYTITETNEITGYNWTYTVNGATAGSPVGKVDVGTGAPAEAAFENTYVQKTGSLLIKKTASGAAVPNLTKFKVTGPLEVKKPNTWEFTYQEMTDLEEGGRGYRLDDIPLGKYKVEEVDGTGKVTGYVLTVEGNGDYELVEGQEVTALIQNKYTPAGSLTINKTFKVLPEDDLTDDQKGKITFEVIGPNGYKEQFSYRDFPNGSLTKDLPEGKYTITEINCDIPGYELVTKPAGKTITVDLKQGDHEEAVFTNTYEKKEYKLIIEKKITDLVEDDNDWKSIDDLPGPIKENTRFKITDKDGKLVQEFTLADFVDGRMAFDLSDGGPYIITETNPNNELGIPIYCSDSQFNVTIINHEDKIVTFENQYVDAGIIKGDKEIFGLYDFEKDQLEKDILFDICDENGTVIKTVNLEQLRAGVKVPFGRYKLVERNTNVPGYTGPHITIKVDGSDVDSEDYSFEISANNRKKIVSFTNTYERDPSDGGTIGIIKRVIGLDGFNNGAALDQGDLYNKIRFLVEEKTGGKWYPYGKNGGEYSLADFAGGNTIALPAGVFKITERYGDVQDYKLNTITFTIAGKPHTVTPDTPVEFAIEKDSVLQIDILNTYTKVGKLEIIKKIRGYGDLTPDQQKLIKFEVRDSNKKLVASPTYYDILKKNTLEYDKLSNLPIGDYTIKEVQTNIDDKYACKIDPENATVTVGQGQTVTVTFTNTYSRKMGSLKITKILNDLDLNSLDDTQKAAIFKGMQFEVTNSDGIVVDSITYDKFSNETSHTFSELPTGNYTVTESIGDDLKKSYKVDIEGNGQTVTVGENETAEVTITNTFTEVCALRLVKEFGSDVIPDDIGANLSFTVNRVNSDGTETEISTIHYNDPKFVDGEYTLSDLAPGYYTVTETDNTTGYECTTAVKVGEANYSGEPIEIQKGETVTFHFTNTYKEISSLKIIKNITGLLSREPMSSEQASAIHFTVTDADNNVVDTFTYANMDVTDGVAVREEHGLVPGIYTVTETIHDPDFTLFGDYKQSTKFVFSGKVQVGLEAKIDIGRGDNVVNITNDYQELPPLSVVKKSERTKLDFVDKDRRQFPIWRFTLTISDLNPKTAGGSTTTFTDIFDKDQDHAAWFRLASEDEVKAVNGQAPYYLMTADGEILNAPQAEFKGNTITISDITNETPETFQFVYYLIVKDAETLDTINTPPTGERQTGIFYGFHNTLTYSPKPGDEPMTAEADYKYTFTAVSKTLNEFNDTTDRANYSITLNPDAKKIGDNNTITATDTCSPNQEILLSSIKVSPEKDVSYILDETKRSIAFTLPNCTPVTVSYDTAVTDSEGDITLSNEIMLSGFSQTVEETYTQTTSGDGTSSLLGLNILKTDATDHSQRLSGATFALYDSAEPETVLTTFTTDKKGIVPFENWEAGTDANGNTTYDSFKVDHEYILKETVAPTGYHLPVNQKPIRFRFSPTDSKDVLVLRNGAELIVTNEPVTTTLKVTKVFDRWDKQEQFSFRLIPANALTPMPKKGGEIAIATKDHPIAEFGKIYLNLGIGTYHYRIQEIVDNTPGIVYDTTAYPVTVQVSADNNGDGYLEVAVTYGENGTELKVKNEYRPVSVSGSKTWDDDNDRDRKRPDSITIHLFADGVEKASKAVTAADNWSWEFTDLPMHKNNNLNDKIKYTITEDPVEGYTTQVNGYNVTNSYTPEKTSVSGSKIWKDTNNQDGSRPRTITVNLLKNGEKVDSKSVSGPNWSFTFDNLPKNEAGIPITYTVTEDKVHGYTTVITGDAETGFEITNSHTPHRWRDWSNPKTGKTDPMMLWIGLLLLSGAGLFAVSIFGKKKGKYQR